MTTTTGRSGLQALLNLGTVLRNTRPFVDLKQAYWVTVTQEHEKKGKQRSTKFCTFALAIRVKFPDCTSVDIYRTVTYFRFPNRVERGRNSRALYLAVCTFDETGVFPPGDYEILPMASASRAVRSKRPKPHPRTGARRRQHVRPRGSGSVDWILQGEAAR